MYNKILKEIISHKDPEKAKILSGFFKTGKGQYGEGDLFLGITVPVSRKIAQKYGDITFSDISKLIKDKYHEVRLVALLILVHKYKILSTKPTRQDLVGISARKVLAEKKKIVDFYLKNTKYINNWDLVDLSAHYILGDYLLNLGNSNATLSARAESVAKSSTYDVRIKKILEKLAKSKNIWERRIAIVATFALIKKGESKWTLHISKMLLKDEHDLIHKACGWMLREVGKNVRESELTAFLDIEGYKMPRTMLRYAIERLKENKRKSYLNLKQPIT